MKSAGTKPARNMSCGFTLADEALARDAHEVANLATALLGSLELVSLAATGGRSVDAQLSTARRAAERIGDLSRRIEAGLRAGVGPTPLS